MLNATFAKVFNILITSLTTCSCKAREYAAKTGDLAENNQETTTEVQGNYPDFKKNLAQKKFVISTVSRIQPVFGKSRLRTARSRMLTIRMLSSKIWIWKPKISRNSRVFWIIFVKKDFLRKPRITWTLERCWGL